MTMSVTALACHYAALCQSWEVFKTLTLLFVACGLALYKLGVLFVMQALFWVMNDEFCYYFQSFWQKVNRFLFDLIGKY